MAGINDALVDHDIDLDIEEEPCWNPKAYLPTEMQNLFAFKNLF